MNINIRKKINKELNNDEINICIEHSANTNADNIIEYIKKLRKSKNINKTG